MAIIDVLKTAAKVAQEAGKIELYGQILEVYEKLLDQQKRIEDLEKENKELKEKLEVKDSLVYENNTYWTVKDGIKTGPFCSRCWDSEHKIIRMHPSHNPAFHECPGCKSGSVQTNPNYRPVFTSRKPPDSNR